jgi:hypothetical protein
MEICGSPLLPPKYSVMLMSENPHISSQSASLFSPCCSSSVILSSLLFVSLLYSSSDFPRCCSYPSSFPLSANLCSQLLISHLCTKVLTLFPHCFSSLFSRFSFFHICSPLMLSFSHFHPLLLSLPHFPPVACSVSSLLRLSHLSCLPIPSVLFFYLPFSSLLLPFPSILLSFSWCG